MLELREKKYSLYYTIGRIEMMEKATGMPVMAVISSGAIGLFTLKQYIAFGLQEEGYQGHVEYKKAITIAHELLETVGYMALSEAFAEAIQRDCGFLFPKA